MGPTLRYSVLRLGLFVSCLGVLLLAGLRGLPLVLFAAAISFALSYLLLRRQREAMARVVADRIDARSRRRRPGPRPGSDEDVEDTRSG